MYLKKDDYITVLGFLMHNTVRKHRPKSPSEFSDISTKIVIKKTTKLGVRIHRTPSEITVRIHRGVRIHRTPSEITVRFHHTLSEITVRNQRYASEITRSEMVEVRNHRQSN